MNHCENGSNHLYEKAKNLTQYVMDKPMFTTSEPIYSSLFNINFVTTKLSDNELAILSDQVKWFEKRNNERKFDIGFNLNEIDRKIEPTNSIQKLIDKRNLIDRLFKCNNDFGYIDIEIHNKKQEIIGVMRYEDIRIDSPVQLDGFDYSSENVFDQSVTMSYKYCKFITK